MRKQEPMSANTDYLRKLGYERSDVSLPTLLKWLGALVVFAGGTALVTWVIYKVFVPEIAVEETSFAIKVPPEPNPLIQVNPKRDLREFRAEEEARLNGYGWVDKKSGIVHIPVSRAMQLVLQKGLPPREPGSPGAAEPAAAPAPNATNTLSTAPNGTGSSPAEAEHIYAAPAMPNQPGSQPGAVQPNGPGAIPNPQGAAPSQPGAAQGGPQVPATGGPASGEGRAPGTPPGPAGTIR